LAYLPWVTSNGVSKDVRLSLNRKLETLIQKSKEWRQILGEIETHIMPVFKDFKSFFLETGGIVIGSTSKATPAISAFSADVPFFFNSDVHRIQKDKHINGLPGFVSASTIRYDSTSFTSDIPNHGNKLASPQLQQPDAIAVQNRLIPSLNLPPASKPKAPFQSQLIPNNLVSVDINKSSLSNQRSSEDDFPVSYHSWSPVLTSPTPSPHYSLPPPAQYPRIIEKRKSLITVASFGSQISSAQPKQLNLPSPSSSDDGSLSNASDKRLHVKENFVQVPASPYDAPALSSDDGLFYVKESMDYVATSSVVIQDAN
jgi:hypothetical protein